MPKFNPNSELVVSEYLRSLPLSTSTNFGVGFVLPENETLWKDGFVQVIVVGGTPGLYVPQRNPVIQVDCWVPSIGSAKPSWPKANTIAENILEQTFRLPGTNGYVVSLDKYNTKDARVQSAYPISEVRRMNNDPSGHARYSFDLALSWVTLEDPTV